MVEGYSCEIEKPRGSKAKAQRTEGFTGMLPVDPVARIDLDRRIRIIRLWWLRRRRRRRSTAASPAQVDPELPGVVWHGICPQTRSSTRRTQPRCLTGRAGGDGYTHRKGAAGGTRCAPASLCRRQTARGHPQVPQAASSPPREALHCSTTKEGRRPRGTDSGGGGLGL
jgi:hypothetical protein